MVHSLGGIVLKKALCLSQVSVDEHLRQADQCLHGIAFLGTPHRGADLAPIMDAAAKILHFLGSRVNPNLGQVLQRGSMPLTDIEDSFAVWLESKRESTGRRANITCFHEELGLPGAGKVRYTVIETECLLIRTGCDN